MGNASRGHLRDFTDPIEENDFSPNKRISKTFEPHMSPQQTNKTREHLARSVAFTDQKQSFVKRNAEF